MTDTPHRRHDDYVSPREIGEIAAALRNLSTQLSTLQNNWSLELGRLHGRMDEILKSAVPKEDHIRLVGEVGTLRNDLGLRATRDEHAGLARRVDSLQKRPALQTGNGGDMGNLRWVRDLVAALVGVICALVGAPMVPGL